MKKKILRKACLNYIFIGEATSYVSGVTKQRKTKEAYVTTLRRKTIVNNSTRFFAGNFDLYPKGVLNLATVCLCITVAEK
jgi:hypothetical protein